MQHATGRRLGGLKTPRVSGERGGTLRRVGRRLALLMLAVAFLGAVTKCKLDRDPSNDAQGKCLRLLSTVVVVSVAVGGRFLHTSRKHSTPRVLAPRWTLRRASARAASARQPHHVEAILFGHAPRDAGRPPPAALAV